MRLPSLARRDASHNLGAICDRVFGIRRRLQSFECSIPLSMMHGPYRFACESLVNHTSVLIYA